jgi:hypothetical protein
MISRIGILFLFMLGFCHAAPLKLFSEKSFNAASLAEAANHFIDLGESSAVKELSTMASDDIYSAKLEFSINERIGWICRIIFEPKAGKALRPPLYGGLMLPENTMPEKSWPLYPVALSGSTYFVLSEGYILAGVAEKPIEYIRYCQNDGTFRKSRVVLPQKDQALKDANALRQSKAWKAIKWQDSGQTFSYTMPKEIIWQFIEKQAESIR